MKKISLLVIIFLTIFNFNAKLPDWVESYGSKSKYDESKYITGFGIAQSKGKNSINVESAKQYALRSISSNIKTKIVSTLETKIEEKNTEVESYSKMNVQTSVYLNISGIKKYEKYYDKKSDQYYALCVVDRDVYHKTLEIERNNLIEEYKSKIDSINTFIKKKNITKAKAEYEESNKLLQKLNENYLIANYLKDGNENLDELNKLFKIKGTTYSKVQKSEITSIKELSSQIMSSFDNADIKGKTFAFLPAYYKSTKISSEFFSYLKDYCNIIIEKKGGKLKEFKDEKNAPDLVFKGSFFNTSTGYKIMYSLTDTSENKTLGISEIDITNEFVKSTGMKILPDNIESALEDNKILYEADLQESNVKFRAWTAKGSEDLVFKEGEDVTFYVQVSQSGYISILYHLAYLIDGKNRLRTPLLQNYYIPPNQINKPVKIDITFEVYPPFGTETAQFFFSTKERNPIETVIHDIEGEEYEILAEDYKEFITKERGMKKSLKNEEFAETFVTITTVPK